MDRFVDCLCRIVFSPIFFLLLLIFYFIFFQDTLIVWSEGDNFDLALSFQEKAGCDEIWEKICQVRKWYFFILPWITAVYIYILSILLFQKIYGCFIYLYLFWCVVITMGIIQNNYFHFLLAFFSFLLVFVLILCSWLNLLVYLLTKTRDSILPISFMSLAVFPILIFLKKKTFKDHFCKSAFSHSFEVGKFPSS